MALRSVKVRLEDAAPVPGVDRSLRSQGFSGAAKGDDLEELLAFAALSQQVHSRTTFASRQALGEDARVRPGSESFDLDEMLQLVAEYAVTITGADGVALAVADGAEIVLRASAGAITPDVGSRIDRDSAFSGACIRTAQIVTSDDTEADPRVNLEACRRLGVRSLVAVPLESRDVVFGVVEAFSKWPAGFTSEDLRNLILLAELVSRALTPEDEIRLTKSAQAATARLEGTTPEAASESASAAAGEDAVVQAEAAQLPQEQVPEEQVPEEQVLRDEALQEQVVQDRVGTGMEPTEAIATPEAADEPVPAAVAASHEAVLSLQTQVARPSILIARSRVLVPLLCIGIAALVAGIWWMRSRSAARTDAAEKVQSTRPAAGNAAVATAHAAGVSANVVVNRGSGAVKDGKSGSGRADGLPASSATLQELLTFPRVTGVEHESAADSTTIVIHIESGVQYESHRLSGPDRIYFDLPSTQLPPELFGKSIEVRDSLLKRIRVSQPVAGLTRVVLETRGQPLFSLSTQENPSQLVIELHAEDSRPQP